MSKLIDINNLDKFSKALDAHYKELIDKEKARALAEEQKLQVKINATEDMLGGKSIRYVTQAEYDGLTEEEKNNSEMTYFITDAIDSSHDHENKDFLDNLAARTIAVGNKSQLFDGVSNLVYSIEDIGAAPAEHNHDYNDLTNRPCYDTREFENVVIEYDGVAEGKVTGQLGMLGIYNPVKVAELPADKVESYKEALNNGYVVTIDNGDGTTSTYEGQSFYTFDGFYSKDYYFFMAPEAFYTDINHTETFVEEPGIYFNIDKNIIKLEFTVASGELKVIEAKYLTNSPGMKVEEGTTFNDYLENGNIITAGKNAEVFNDCFENIATGNYSHAEGYRTQASGDYSHAEGSNSIANGMFSHAEGFNTKALGEESHAEGRSTKATNDCAHAEGQNSEATGFVSHAEGNGTKATGNSSHSENAETLASGVRSHAEGFNTIAAGTNQHVQGKYNVEDAEEKYAHIVGNGNLNTRSNAHTLDWNGNAWFKGDVFVGENNQDDGKKLATEEFVTNSIEELRKEMVILEEDDLTMDGLIDNTFPSLTTENKTLLGAINELNNKSTEEIDKAVIDEILLDVFNITIE